MILLEVAALRCKCTRSLNIWLRENRATYNTLVGTNPRGVFILHPGKSGCQRSGEIAVVEALAGIFVDKEGLNPIIRQCPGRNQAGLCIELLDQVKSRPASPPHPFAASQMVSGSTAIESDAQVTAFAEIVHLV